MIVPFENDECVIKGVKKVRSAIKLCYYLSHYVSYDINVTGIF